MKSYELLQNFNARAELARRNFSDFVSYTKPDYQFNWHHRAICDKLMDFSRGKIKKLMLFVPPQHGKSELATRRFPAYLLGLNPKLKITVCSYSATIASAFNRDIQRVIDNELYHDVFPETILNSSNVATSALHSFLRNSEIFEIVNHRGFCKTVGVGGSLTGTPVDIGIIDDPFKDRQEAMSTTIRNKVWSWYTDVFETRLHNQSQQLLIMTRWDDDDLAGKLLQRDRDWHVVKYAAIKEREDYTDPRAIGDVLWPEKHSLQRILKIKETSSITFNSLYQQEPKAPKEVLVFPEWVEIDEMPGYTQYYGGDFGYPTAVCEVQWHNKNIYLNEILYDETQPTNSDIIKSLKAFGLEMSRPYVWDSAEPRSIKDLKSGGMNAREAEKGRDSINWGINAIKEFKIHVTKSSHNLKRELNNYQYITFKGKRTDQPIDDFNHLIDAIRYVLSVFYKKTNGVNVSFHK